jgi:hypothetical protein
MSRALFLGERLQLMRRKGAERGPGADRREGDAGTFNKKPALATGRQDCSHQLLPRCLMM